MVCFIIPPHILQEVARRGTSDQKKHAKHTLKISEDIRAQRQSLTLTLSQRERELFGFPLDKVDRGGLKKRMIYTTNDSTDLPGQIVRTEGQAAIHDDAADQAYAGTGATWDMYERAFQRNSIDNSSMDLISTVHYSQNYDNAFWDGKQMVYGDGDGDLFGLFTKPIDVTGHELTHGVTQYSANLTYQDQSGALNESFSDVFGVLVKQWHLQQTAAIADWLIGEGIFTSHVQGKALRSMKAPGTAYDDPVLGKDPQPGSMDAFVKTMDDNGGVHINSGIPNHAFALAAVAIGGYSWEKAGAIWYDTLTQKLQSNATFADCAQATIASAQELFGKGSKEEQAVEQAWKTVKVI